MPARERIRRALYRPAVACRRPAGADVAGRAARRRNALAQLRRQSAWLVWLVTVIGLIAWVLAFSHGPGKGVCTMTRPAVCRQVPAPARPGGTVNRGP